MGMKLPIFGGELFPQNMVRVKEGGVWKCVGGLMDVVFGEAFMKGGRVSKHLSFEMGEGTRIRF